MTFSVVWLKRDEARFFEFSDSEMLREVIPAAPPNLEIEKNSPSTSSETAFFETILSRMHKVQNVVLLGPDDCKDEFKNYALQRRPELSQSFVATETVDRPTDNQVAAFAIRYYRAPSATQ